MTVGWVSRLRSTAGRFEELPDARSAVARPAVGAADAGLAIAQHSVRFDPGDLHGGLRRVRVLRQGDNVLSFYER